MNPMYFIDISGDSDTVYELDEQGGVYAHYKHTPWIDWVSPPVACEPFYQKYPIEHMVDWPGHAPELVPLIG